MSRNEKLDKTWGDPLPNYVMALKGSERRFLKAEKQGAKLFKPGSTTATEAQFVQRALSKLYKVHRPSWPDYLVELDGKLMAVEVKGPGDWLSANQRRTFELLIMAGIPIYIWDSTEPDFLIPWERARRLSGRRRNRTKKKPTPDKTKAHPSQTR